MTVASPLTALSVLELATSKLNVRWHRLAIRAASSTCEKPRDHQRTGASKVYVSSLQRPLLHKSCSTVSCPMSPARVGVGWGNYISCVLCGAVDLRPM
ncbi:hypothetical protein J6590_032370 [Homalodisca vitripennis]|nr:hypothetical protein J6590_032370 [Homalodisca vitripennis]